MKCMKVNDEGNDLLIIGFVSEILLMFGDFQNELDRLTDQQTRATNRGTSEMRWRT